MVAQSISCTVERQVQEEEELESPAHFNSINVFDQVAISIMAKEQCKDLVLGLALQYMLAGNKLKPSDVARVNSKAEHKYLLQFYQITLKKSIHYKDDWYHQLILPEIYDA